MFLLNSHYGVDLDGHVYARLTIPRWPDVYPFWSSYLFKFAGRGISALIQCSFLDREVMVQQTAAAVVSMFDI